MARPSAERLPGAPLLGNTTKFGKSGPRRGRLWPSCGRPNPTSTFVEAFAACRIIAAARGCGFRRSQTRTSPGYATDRSTSRSG
jgi:hypothetical protein